MKHAVARGDAMGMEAAGAMGNAMSRRRGGSGGGYPPVAAGVHPVELPLAVTPVA